MVQTEGDLVVAIMAGGAGTRFWPLSTREKPKQFLQLFGQRSLLQQSFDRVAGLTSPDRILVLTSADFVGLVQEQLPEIPPENIIAEPMRRDTAAAVCLGAGLCHRRFGPSVMAVMTADHMIEPVDAFQRALLSAARGARQSGALYTFGVRPTFPATGYGYMEIGDRLMEDEDVPHHRLVRFKEKPEASQARSYLESGRFLWNSGMFVWTTDSILREIKMLIPRHLEAIYEALEYDRRPEWPEALAGAFSKIESISVDYAIMERAADVRTVTADFAWTDVGGWAALGELLPRDTAGNRNRGRVVNRDAAGNLVYCEDETETVLMVGVENLVVVRAGGRTLIAAKDRVEEIKELVRELSEVEGGE